MPFLKPVKYADDDDTVDDDDNVDDDYDDYIDVGGYVDDDDDDILTHQEACKGVSVLRCIRGRGD